jgi:hypothetical protein
MFVIPLLVAFAQQQAIALICKQRTVLLSAKQTLCRTSGQMLQL